VSAVKPAPEVSYSSRHLGTRISISVVRIEAQRAALLRYLKIERACPLSADEAEAVEKELGDALEALVARR
jgi:hypothetical protein